MATELRKVKFIPHSKAKLVLDVIRCKLDRVRSIKMDTQNFYCVKSDRILHKRFSRSRSFQIS